MEQKLFEMRHDFRRHDCECEFPDELKALLSSGWRIMQISAYNPNGKEGHCFLLLQKD